VAVGHFDAYGKAEVTRLVERLGRYRQLTVEHTAQIRGPQAP
jgi:hypothetical protein